MVSRMYRIYGFVQGVGFRSFVYHRAVSLGIKGYVENEPDGSVTVIAEGRNESMELFESRILSGPVFSRVDSVQTTDVPFSGYIHFEIR